MSIIIYYRFEKSTAPQHVIVSNIIVKCFYLSIHSTKKLLIFCCRNCTVLEEICYKHLFQQKKYFSVILHSTTLLWVLKMFSDMFLYNLLIWNFYSHVILPPDHVMHITLMFFTTIEILGNITEPHKITVVVRKQI